MAIYRTIYRIHTSKDKRRLSGTYADRPIPRTCTFCTVPVVCGTLESTKMGGYARLMKNKDASLEIFTLRNTVPL